MYRTAHPTAAEYTFFSTEHAAFSRTDHLLDHNTKLNKLQKIEIMWRFFSNHNGIKLEINNRRQPGKSTNMCELNHILFFLKLRYH